MKTRISGPAKADIRSAFDFLARDNPRAAQAARNAIRRAAISLQQMAGRGRQSALGGHRELPVRGAPYVIVYRVEVDEVVIIRVFHTSQSRA